MKNRVPGARIGSGDVPIPAVGEEEAQGETGVLFADIRRVLGVPVVNLIWRHLATFPSGLDWAWGAVRPFYHSGAAAREGAALLVALPLPSLATWSRGELRAAAVDGVAERTLITVLDSYNRSNAMNLVALTALGLRLKGQPEAPAAPAGPVAPAAPPDGPPERESQMPALLTLAQMAPATADMVRQLDALGERSDGRVRASMYRHLAHWPLFLALARARIAPLHDDGRLAGLIAAATDLARASAVRVAGELAASGPAPTAATRAAVQVALTGFTGGVIPKMVPICALLRRAMPS
ncbi:MAG TPA: hypothetical protein VML54_17350 [Candidatus Limnocylindrales bacterium]|nr:hypothetical protein [Candidatus Limnocylindrales bacterium]